jgi:glutamine---fructose-6-phosphate transaminase (isomerizing)
MNGFYLDIMDQPTSLRRLTDFYQSDQAEKLGSALPAPQFPVLTGMGASFNAASIAALNLQSMGSPALAIEAADLLNYNMALLQRCSPLIYISQSGKSGEVIPILEACPPELPIVAVTNDLDSPLARRAKVTFPLLAGTEKYVATKTYLNSLATLWLLVRHWQGQQIDLAPLHQVIGQSETILPQNEAIAAQWLEKFANVEQLMFLGHGPHAITARHCAMMLSEWAKQSALAMSIGAFHHGTIEIVKPGLGAIIFTPPNNDKTRTSALELAADLEQYGVRVLLVENGLTRNLAEPNRADSNQGIDEILSPLLDVIPVQLFIEVLARQRGLEPGFRFISKIVTRL